MDVSIGFFCNFTTMKQNNRITSAKNPGQSVRIYAPYEQMPKKEELANLFKLIITNGERNDYAERVEYLINNSVSGNSISNLFGRFLIGKGDLVKNDLDINPKQKFWELLEEIKNDYQKQKGFAVLIKYNVEGKPIHYYHKPFTDVRKMRRDDNGNEVTYRLSKDWIDQSITKFVENDLEYTYYAFNPDPEVVKKQIKESGGVNKYKGQIFYFNGDSNKFHYPHSWIHPVLNDTNTEFLTQLMRNKRVRGGGMSKKIFIIPPTMPEHLDVPDEQLTPEDLAVKRQCETKSETLRDNIQNFFGAENNEGSLVVEMEFAGDDIDKLMKVIDVKFDSEDGMFEKNEDRIEDNIRACYFNPPPILIKSDNSFFGSSGESIVEAKKFYDENVAFERKKLARALSKCFQKFEDGINLTSLISSKTAENINGETPEKPQNIENESQANLRGSVGGVQGILQIQESVIQGTTGYEPAVVILKEIFGFTDNKARELLGSKDEINAAIQESKERDNAITNNSR